MKERKKYKQTVGGKIVERKEKEWEKEKRKNRYRKSEKDRSNQNERKGENSKQTDVNKIAERKVGESRGIKKTEIRKRDT